MDPALNSSPPAPRLPLLVPSPHLPTPAFPLRRPSPHTCPPPPTSPPHPRVITLNSHIDIYRGCLTALRSPPPKLEEGQLMVTEQREAPLQASVGREAPSLLHPPLAGLRSGWAPGPAPQPWPGPERPPAAQRADCPLRAHQGTRGRARAAVPAAARRPQVRATSLLCAEPREPESTARPVSPSAWCGAWAWAPGPRARPTDHFPAALCGAAPETGPQGRPGGSVLGGFPPGDGRNVSHGRLARPGPSLVRPGSKPN